MSGEGKLDSLRRVRPEGRASARPGLFALSAASNSPAALRTTQPLHQLFSSLFRTTAGRRKILASPFAHEAIVGAWHLATKWLVGRFVMMPDHVHFFCAPNGLDASSLEVWMRYWKSIATRNLGEVGGSVWQRHHWDRQLRRGESYDDEMGVCAEQSRAARSSGRRRRVAVSRRTERIAMVSVQTGHAEACPSGGPRFRASSFLSPPR